MIKIRCSQLGNIMADAKSLDKAVLAQLCLEEIAAKKSKTEADQALLRPAWDMTLSVGAKTYLTAIAKEFVYGFHEVVTTKYMDKGIAVEDESIQLYNDVFFTSYVKNKERRENQWLTGELDLLPNGKITDIKSAWSLATFPATADDAHDSLYEWQGRGYMMLWDVDAFEVAYCMVSTPEELIRYEQRELHIVDHIDPRLRVTLAQYQRDLELEERIKRKVTAAQSFIAATVERIRAEHNH